MMRVLVAYGSKRGGTQGIAELVRDALVRRGLSADAVAVEAHPRVQDYDAVIVGGALYAMRWPRAARHFVRRNARTLATMPVWFFSSGPLDASATEHDVPPPKRIRLLMARAQARGHVTFGGRLAPDAHGFVASAMAKKLAGDWRDHAQIEAWATGVADDLAAPAAALARIAAS
jgi:menaquinone-dependent protoporphyrinogen oxidase